MWGAQPGAGQKLSRGWLGLGVRFCLQLGPDPGLGLEPCWGWALV